ncbi:hypothetical protein [Streptomyces galilaeus]|uniref:hypothetical protein n=1 Tax=Streptomyces galilaeus TaxID=33899 RepID=UPI0038F6E799
MPEEIEKTTPAAEAGAESTPQGTGEEVPQAAADNDAAPEGAEALGEPGKRALDAMKSKWQTERDQRRDLERQLAEAKAPKAAEGDQLDPDAIREEARAEVRRDLGVQLEAKGRLANPEDVQRYPEYFKDVKADDPASIRAAVDELLEDRPYLAVSTGRPRFEGTADGGASRKPAGPTQLTRADLKGMSADQIVKAKREGRLKNLLSGN